jgi:predicted RNase H-like HicB family nuclease
MSGVLAEKICSAIMSSPQRFRVAIHRAKGCYFARVIDLPGCVARGASEVEAVENARAAIRAFQWAAQVLAHDDPTIQLEISA